MTERLYYSDSYTTEFTAQIVGRKPIENRPEQVGIILDRTYLYPSSGGQPHDTGHIAACRVDDVLIDNESGAVVHIVIGTPPEDEIRATIDWQRRFDHMQQHTGQHILSQAFLRISAANTVGFHLSADTVTIDLDTASLSENELARTERLANEVIWQNRPIHILQIPQDEANQLAVRRVPADLTGLVRLIEIADFDLTACGGTHVAATGEVGVIKINSLESRSEKTRVQFLCGSRALKDFIAKNQVIDELTRSFTTGFKELPEAAHRLREENKALRRDNRRQKLMLLEQEAAHLIDEGQPKQGLVIVKRIFTDRDAADLRTLAQGLTTQDDVVALLGLAGPRCHLQFCRSANVPTNMRELLRSALSALGTSSGGGTPVMAQGGGVPAGVDELARILLAAETELLER